MDFYTEPRRSDCRGKNKHGQYREHCDVLPRSRKKVTKKLALRSRGLGTVFKKGCQDPAGLLAMWHGPWRGSQSVFTKSFESPKRWIPVNWVSKLGVSWTLGSGPSAARAPPILRRSADARRTPEGPKRHRLDDSSAGVVGTSGGHISQSSSDTGRLTFARDS